MIKESFNSRTGLASKQASYRLVFHALSVRSQIQVSPMTKTSMLISAGLKYPHPPGTVANTTECQDGFLFGYIGRTAISQPMGQGALSTDCILSDSERTARANPVSVCLVFSRSIDPPQHRFYTCCPGSWCPGYRPNFPRLYPGPCLKSNNNKE